MELIEIIALIFLFVCFVVLCYCIGKRILDVPSHKNEEDEPVGFYDEDAFSGNSDKVPSYASNFGNTDSKVRSSVRFNRSMYYDRKTFEELNKQSLNKKFPMGTSEQES